MGLTSVAHIYWGAQLKESVCLAVGWERGEVELEIHVSQCYFPTQQLDSPMNSEREEGSSVDRSLPAG